MEKFVAVLFGVIVLISLVGCGVKAREPETVKPTSAPSGEGLPPNVFTSNQKKYLVFLSQSSFKVGVAKVTYKVVTPTLNTLRGVENEFKVKYFMPEMPEMPVTPAVVKLGEQGNIDVEYDISMEGAWEFKLEIYAKENGVSVLSDQFTHKDRVKE